MQISDLFDLSHTLARTILEEVTVPWDVLSRIKDGILDLQKHLDLSVYEKIGENIYAAKTAKIAPSASITGPCIIGEYTEIRHCAFIRGSALIGNRCVVGNSTELKNCILFDNVQVPHFNYVGDSVLGYQSHLGAGAVTSNVKSDKTPVSVHTCSGKIPTGLKKFGALVGDFTEVGCNSVLCPGTVIGKNCTVYPLSRVRGSIPENSIFKTEKDIVRKT